MLLHLQIRNFAIIPALDQDFCPGFTAISGETGAGKSILVDALGLLLGKRSDSSWVRAGADRAELSAAFSVAANDEAQAWLREHELEEEDQCLLRRCIQSSGRSRAWVNGIPVTVAQLAELGDLLVEVHGQNEHVRLVRSGRQRNLLDTTGNFSKNIDTTRRAMESWQEVQEQREALEAEAALPPAEAEFLRFQLSELEAQAVSPEEVHKIEQEHKLLSSSGDLLQKLDQAASHLDDDTKGVTVQLSATLALIKPIETLDPGLKEVARMLDEAIINSQEASATLAASLASIDLDPDRLSSLDSQLGNLGDLARKHGIELEGLTALRDRLAERLQRFSQFDEELEILDKACEERLGQYRKAARALSRARKSHAKTLAAQVEELMTDLGMDGGQFSIRIDHEDGAEPTLLGNDRVVFMVSANAGMPLAPLGKVASGGELSRISLALKVASADGASRTQVFDEIDAGVGGDTANAVGRLLGKTAANAQALCVTHLAQVAARAAQQLRVSKKSAQESTSVDASLLGEADRVEEIARMLGGKLSDQSRAHAREMLEAAANTLQ